MHTARDKPDHKELMCCIDSAEPQQQKINHILKNIKSAQLNHTATYKQANKQTKDFQIYTTNPNSILSNLFSRSRSEL